MAVAQEVLQTNSNGPATQELDAPISTEQSSFQRNLAAIGDKIGGLHRLDSFGPEPILLAARIAQAGTEISKVTLSRLIAPQAYTR